MTHSLGFRKRFGVLAPSTNTVVQPEWDRLRPQGVTNHCAPIHVRDRLILNETDFFSAIDDVSAALDEAVDLVMTSRPDHLIAGLSLEQICQGTEGSRQLRERLEKRAGIGVTTGADACEEALRKYGGAKRLGILMPFSAAADAQAWRFFTELGYEVVTVKSLGCDSPERSAQISERTLRDAVDEIDDPMIEAIVQVGSNVAMARVAAIAEFWLDIPVIAINTATYWWALRRNGIGDKVYGFGSLLEDF